MLAHGTYVPQPHENGVKYGVIGGNINLQYISLVVYQVPRYGCGMDWTIIHSYAHNTINPADQKLQLHLNLVSMSFLRRNFRLEIYLLVRKHAQAGRNKPWCSSTQDLIHCFATEIKTWNRRISVMGMSQNCVVPRKAKQRPLCSHVFENITSIFKRIKDSIEPWRKG